ncbi:hypothetical protein [Streptomyces sp. NPDC001568]|uniref:hypothetical protein n=1 Tax=Streptomyces sp. NPDC001568 TaxID=3364588 RepID=UPI00369A40B8
MTDTDASPPDPTGNTVPSGPAGLDESPAVTTVAAPAAPTVPAQPGPPVPPVPPAPPIAAPIVFPAGSGPAKASRRWLLPVGTGLLGFLAGAVFVWSLPWGGDGSAQTFTLTGTMALSDSDGFLSLTDNGCAGKGGYKDIRTGTSVTVYDDAGKVVATGSLGDGTRTGLTCAFPVSVADVPKGARFYQVEVSHRGKLTVAKDEAMAGTFGASLG